MQADKARWCKYCHITWDVERDPATDEVLNNSDTNCPDCDSDDAITLEEAQRQVAHLDW